MENKICVYAICKNEAKFVDTWVESMKEADYIVVVDTGSEDNTYELLSQHSEITTIIKKPIVPWRFDDARNEALSLVPADTTICVSTDLDERFEPGWADVLRENWIPGVHEQAIYKYVWSHNENGTPARIFKYDKIHSNSGWEWIYPVHECLIKDGKDYFLCDKSLDLFDKITLHHYQDRTKSRASYLPLLELRKEESNDVSGLIYLTHEYYYQGRYEDSLRQNKEVLETYRDILNPIEVACLYLFAGDASHMLDRVDDTVNYYFKAILVDNTYREPYISLAQTLNEIGLYHQAIGVMKDCLKNTYRHYSWLENDTSWTYAIYDILSIAYYYIDDINNSYLNVQKAMDLMDGLDQRIHKNYDIIKSAFVNKLKGDSTNETS